MKKPLCYQCRWRGIIPGSAHSKCCHPYNEEINDPLLNLLATFASVGRIELPPMSDERLKIKAHEAGIKSGWFHFPFNFDPIWLEECNGFEEFREKDARITNKHKFSSSTSPTCEQPYFCEDCPLKFECFTERNEITR